MAKRRIDNTSRQITFEEVEKRKMKEYIKKCGERRNEREATIREYQFG